MITALLAAVAVPAGAGDGDLDPRFSQDGLLVLPLPPLVEGNAEAVAVRVQPDGRIVVLADYQEPDVPPGTAAAALLAYRLLPAGTLDPSFGSGGIAVLELPSLGMRGKALELAPGGKIVVGGSYEGLSGWEWLIVRLLDSGTPDPAFVNAGWAFIHFRPDNCCRDLLEDLAVGADGSILAVGTTQVDFNGTDAGFARLAPDGVLDPAFGAYGRSTADLAFGFEGRVTTATDVLLEPSTGALVFAGHVAVGDASLWAMGRIGPTGSFDSSFNSVGYRVGDFEVWGGDTFNDRMVSVYRHADGSYGGAGDFWPIPLDPAGVRVRLDANGSIDDSWGSSGFAWFAFGPAAETSNNIVAACALDLAERTICVGYRGATAGQFAGIARFVGPTYDTRYRGGGSDYFGFANLAASWASDVTLDPNGRIVVAGTVLYGGGLKRAAVARLIGGLPFTDDFESGDLSGWSNATP